MSEQEQVPHAQEAASTKQPTEDNDSDPGYEDLDDILDQFNPSSAPKPSATQNAAPPTQPAAGSDPGKSGFSSQPSAQSEAEFMAQLQAEFEKTMTNMGVAPEGDAAKEQAREITDMGKEIDEFTKRMEKEGLQPEDLLRAIMGEEGLDAEKSSELASGADKKPESNAQAGPSSESKASFEETIRKTLERMQDSDTSARDAAQTSGSEEDILAQLMKAMESSEGGGEGDDSDLSNLFLNMMHQLTSKELLYEPMKELDERFPAWLESNKSKLKVEDLERYETQQIVVKEIVHKFEEQTYSDDNEKDRQFIWDKMQKMQAAGSPPEDLVTAPFPGAFGGGTGSEGPDPLGGCPTQ